MSIFYVARWSVREADLVSHADSLANLAMHTQREHPLIEEVRLFRERWGTGPRHQYVWMERYQTLAALESDSEPPACTCADVWAPIYALAQDQSFHAAVWTEASSESWFTRDAPHPRDAEATSP